MQFDDLYQAFDSLPEAMRMLVIDAVYAGCCLMLDGKPSAGAKLVLTALKTAGFTELFYERVITDPKAVIEALPAHTELRELLP